MTLVVVVDDERTRPDAVVCLRSSEDALVWLETHDSCDELWLDHDLGGEDTTRAVVLWLLERAFHGDPFPVEQVVVHSVNPVGAEWIASSLERLYPVRRGRLEITI